MRTIERYRILQSKPKTKPIKHMMEVRPVQPTGFTLWVDGSIGYGAIVFDRKEVDATLSRLKQSAYVTVDYLGDREDDSVTPERKEQLKVMAERLQKPTIHDVVQATNALTMTLLSKDKGDAPMKKAPKKEKRVKKEAAPKTDKITLFGLTIGALTHWMRDKGFTFAEASHVLTESGFNIGPTRKNAKTVLKHTLRAHLHCACASKPKLDSEHAEAIGALRAAAPAEEVKAEKVGRKAREKKGTLLPGPLDGERKKKIRAQQKEAKAAEAETATA